MSMYSRQESMNINNNQSIVVIGCGGVGFNVVLQLVMSGVNNIYVFDHDNIEEHNLNRLSIPYNTIGRKKVDVVKEMALIMRPGINIKSFPCKFNSRLIPNGIDYIMDCTDVFNAQVSNKKIADELNIKYMKVGYDGESMSINDNIGMWDTGDTPDGYTVTPSWCVPAIVIASLAVAKVLKYTDKEFNGNLINLYR